MAIIVKFLNLLAALAVVQLAVALVPNLPSNPFRADTLEQTADRFASVVEGIHCPQVRFLSEAITNRDTQLLLLLAPRAGFGKSHLLRRLESGHPGRPLLIPLEFGLDQTPSWNAALDQVLGCCHRNHVKLPTGGRVPILAECGRRLFALLCGDLIRSGIVPCSGNKAETLAAIETHATSIFALHENDAMEEGSFGDWFLRNFEELIGPMADAAGNRTKVLAEVVSEWLRVLCSYEQGMSSTARERWRSLQWGVRQISQTVDGGFLGSGGSTVVAVTSADSEQLASRARLFELLSILAMVRVPLISVDGLDGFQNDSGACLRVADMLIKLRQAADGPVFVLAVNEDVWGSGFAKHLPSAMLDRLTATTLRLRGLTAENAEELVVNRLRDAGEPSTSPKEFLEHIGFRRWFFSQSEPVSPRAVLRYCADAYSRDAVEIEPETEGETRKSASDEAEWVPLQPLASSDSPSDDEGESATRSRVPAEAPASDGVTVAADPVRMARLLRIAGEQFPMVNYEEVALPAHNGAVPPTAGVWKTADGEVWFGLRSFDEPAYWGAVARHVASLGCSAHRKLAVVGSLEGELAESLSDAGGVHLDVIELDASEVSELCEASDLLSAAETGETEIPVPQALAGFVDSLDYFWKRFSRLKV